LLFLSDGTLVACSSGNELKVWSVDHEDEGPTVQVPLDSEVLQVVLAKNTHLLVRTAGGAVYIIDALSGEVLQQAHREGFVGVAGSSVLQYDGKCLARIDRALRSAK